MGKKKGYYPVSTWIFQEWITASGFKNSSEMHEHVSSEEEEFLRYTVYPMFYKCSFDDKYNSVFCFPLVSKTYGKKDPKYVIDNEYFTIVFFHFIDYFEGEDCWEVSFHVKNHKYCDEKIKEFKYWYAIHYDNLYADLKGMPKRFVFPRLDLYDSEVNDFCIEFWNAGKDFMLFKLFDLLRIF